MPVSCRTGCRLAVVAGLVLVLATPAFPATPGKLHTAQNKAAHHEVVSELHAAHALLVNADHDYQGHRAKAAHEVATAIRELSGTHHHHHHHTGTAHPAGQVRAKIPQATSDAHLNHAAQILATALGKMPAGHKSTANVHAAITQIHTALKIK